jgi:predicted phage terminase large subunit-like protein
MSAVKYKLRQAPSYAREDYATVLDNLRVMEPAEAHAATRVLALNDLFFLGVYVLGRPDANNDFVYERCREVQRSPNGHLDLWSREHFKSTIITMWLTIQDILNDPEITFGIFSHTRPIAKAFLRQIKTEFERNDWLKSLFPDVLWQEPHKESPKWSENEGIVVIRKGNPKEATIEAWGLVDGQPTSKHYGVLLYDDIVTLESVTSPEMISKVTSAWQISTNLGSQGGIRRFAGTRYHFADTYKTIIQQESAMPRVYACTLDGTVHGEPRLLSREAIQQKRKDMGPFNFGAQMLLNPKADDTQGFQEDWLRYYGRVNGDRMVKAILIDPASSKKTGSDYTAAFVVGLGEDENIYVLDGERDRLNLSQRFALLARLHRTWKPRKVGYEKYGKDADIEHFNAEMERNEHRFAITAVGGTMSKPDRIKRLIPYFEQGRIWLPSSMWKTDYEGKRYDFTQCFVEDEYLAFPVCLHDDLLDALARIFDIWPGGLPFPLMGMGRSGTQARTEYDELAGGI